jgi:hypothetical protein
MALKLYYKDSNDQFVVISSTTPETSYYDGRTGETTTRQLYIRNDSTSYYYSNIRIKPRDLVDANPYGDVIYTETGWGWKLSAGSDEPTTGEWEDIEWGNEITMSDIGSLVLADTTTYSPFWRLITCPPNTDAIIKTDVIYDVRATERLI